MPDVINSLSYMETTFPVFHLPSRGVCEINNSGKSFHYKNSNSFRVDNFKTGRVIISSQRVYINSPHGEELYLPKQMHYHGLGKALMLIIVTITGFLLCTRYSI